MDCHTYDIIIPKDSCDLDQDEEYVFLKKGDETEKILLHDYEKVYQIPGLYEEVLYDRLKCCSPQMLCRLMGKAMEDQPVQTDDLRVLDFGAGNGVAGEILKEEIGCETLVGVDILPEAKNAALRNRPDIYDDYLVADFMNLDSAKKETLADYDFNFLLSVAALGYDHIGTQAFLTAFEMVSDDAWVAFNIKDRFLSEEDDTGFKNTIQTLMDDHLDVFESKRYVHRLSVADEELYYVGIVGKKNESGIINVSV